ncbi:hypothetical protein ACFL0H_00055 [Thermodesulfobacteriota bacterium]
METILSVVKDDDDKLVMVVGELDEESQVTDWSMSKDFQNALLKELKLNVDGGQGRIMTGVEKNEHKKNVMWAISIIETSINNMGE